MTPPPSLGSLNWPFAPSCNSFYILIKLPMIDVRLEAEAHRLRCYGRLAPRSLRQLQLRNPVQSPLCLLIPPTWAILPVAVESAIGRAFQRHPNRISGNNKPRLWSIPHGLAVAIIKRRMPPIFTLKVLSHGIVGLLAITILALFFVSLRKEIKSGQPVSGLFPLVLIIVTFCILIVLLSASA